MDAWLIWVVAGFALIIAELLTGTFYLLVIGVGALAGAIAAWSGAQLLVQAVVASAIAMGGAFFVHHWHRLNSSGGKGAAPLDIGQPVVLESWANEPAGLARVKYRGTSWDARVAEGRPQPGSTLYINGMEGATLVVGAAPPAR